MKPDAAPGPDLGNEDQAERDGATEDDHQGHDAELHVGLVPGQKGDGGADDAHDAHVVDAHPDVLAVVERRDAHVPGLPRQEAAEKLEGGGATEGKKKQVKNGVVTRSIPGQSAIF